MHPGTLPALSIPSDKLGRYDPHKACNRKDIETVGKAFDPLRSTNFDQDLGKEKTS